MSNPYVGYSATRMEVAPAFAPFSKVIAWIDDETAVVSGDDSGRALEVELPFATQAIVDGMLERIRGYAYQPWLATRAILDPAAELGDGVTVNGLYSVLASVETTFDALMTSAVSAPADEEVDHEYPYISPTMREVKRNRAKTYSLIEKTANDIRLEVNTLETGIAKELEELEESFSNGLGDLSGELTEKLEKYATIALTDSKIQSTVSTLQSYTDTKTGEVVASLKNYSTITQTDSKIQSTVTSLQTYTDGKVSDLSGAVTNTLKSYSTLTQTANSIQAAVSGLLDESAAKALIKLEMGSIKLSASSSEGSTTLTLSGGGAQLSTQTLDLSVKALNIKGKINADQLNITGAITFDDLDENTQIKVNSKGISSSTAKTLITEELVSSPTIIGGEFYASEDSSNYAKMTDTAFSLMSVDSSAPRAELRAYSNLVELALGVGSDSGGENGRLHVMKGVGSVNDGPEQNLGMFHFRNSSGVDSGLVLTDDSNFTLFSGVGNGKIYTDENGIVFDAGPVIVRIDNNNMRVNFYFKYDEDMDRVDKTWFLDSSGLHT